MPRQNKGKGNKPINRMSRQELEVKKEKIENQLKLYDQIKPGRPRKFQTPEDLWNAAVEYFKWAEANPIMSVKKAVSQGEVLDVSEPRMRAFTLTGLCTYIGLDTETYRRYGTGENGKGEFKEVYKIIKQVVDEQKFTGAAADVLNAGFIARDMGMYEKVVSENLNVNVQMTKEEVQDMSKQLEQEF